MLPEIDTGRLKLRLARPGMEAPMARFLSANFAGHLDRWFPPISPRATGASGWPHGWTISAPTAGRAS
jgi:hypothetical protein